MKAIECLATSRPALDLHKEVTKDPIDAKTILSCLHRDFSDSYVQDGFLHYLHSVMWAVYSVRSMRLESALERRVLGSCLAAYRRQLCIGDRGPSWQALVSKSHWQFIGYDFTRVPSASATHVEFHNSSQIIQCSRIFSSARIRESHVYGIIGTIAQWLIPAMEDKDAPWPGT